MTERGNTETLEKLDLTSRLFHSVERGNIKRIEFFLNLGIDINTQNDSGYGLLFAAMHVQNDDRRDRTLSLLLDRGIDPSRCDRQYRRNALIWACILGREKQLEKLILEYGGELDLNDCDVNGMTLLHHATQSGSISLVRCVLNGLLKFELSVDIPDKLGLTPYLHAKRLGFEEIAQILRKEGKASPGQCDKYVHMNATEWSIIGKEDRKRRLITKLNAPNDQLRRTDKYLDSPSRQPLNVSVPPVHKTPSIRRLNAISNDSHLESSGFETISDNTLGRFLSVSNLSDNQGKLKISGTEHDSQSIVSLLNLSSRGTEANSFFKSHFDGSFETYNQKQKFKENTKKEFLMLMSVLSEESSPSFRKPPIVPKIEEEIEAIPPTTKSNNVSSLAILFGKKLRKRNSFLKVAEKGPKLIDKNIHKRLLDVAKNAKKTKPAEIRADGNE